MSQHPTSLGRQKVNGISKVHKTTPATDFIKVELTKDLGVYGVFKTRLPPATNESETALMKWEQYQRAVALLLSFSFPFSLAFGYLSLMWGILWRSGKVRRSNRPYRATCLMQLEH